MIEPMSATAPAQRRWSSGARLQSKWDWRAAANFVGGGSGGGLLLLGLPAAVSGATELYRAIAGVALALMAAGLACILLKLGHPLRALNTLRHPQTSWMTREVLAVPLVFGFGVAAILRPGSLALAAAAALSGLAFLYCQARILFAAQGIPAWRTRGIVSLTVVNGLANGAGLLVCLVAAFAAEATRLAALLLLATLILRQLAWLRYRRALAAAAVPRMTLEVIERLDGRVRVFGHVVPAVLMAMAVLAGGSVPGWLAALAGLLATAMGWALTFTLVTRAAYTRGFELPMRLKIPGAQRARNE